MEFLKTFPQEAQRQRVRLGGTYYVLVFQWSERLEGFYVDIYDDDGEPIALKRRMNVDVDLGEATLDFKGYLVAFGPEDATFEDFGDRLRLTWIDNE